MSDKPRPTADIIADLRRDAQTIYVHSDAPDRARIRDVMREAADRLEAAATPVTIGFIRQSVGEQHASYVEALRVGARWLAKLIASGEVDGRRGE